MPKKTLGAGFRQRNDGKIESRFTIKGKRYSAYGDTLAECKEKEAEKRELIKKGLYIDNQNLTLDKYYQEWKAARRGTVKGNTVLNSESRYKNHIGPALGKRKVVEIEKREIVKLQKELAKKTESFFGQCHHLTVEKHAQFSRRRWNYNQESCRRGKAAEGRWKKSQ